MNTRDEKILSMTAAGHTAPAIAVALGISVPTVQRARRKGAVQGTNGRPRGTKKPTGQVSLSQDTRTRPRYAPGDRRPEKEILQELFATDPGQISLLRQADDRVSADTAAALGIVTDGAYRRKLMRENGIFFQLLSSGKIQIHVSAEHRPELNPIFATEGITPIRTSIESDAQYLVTSSALARLQARAKSV